MSVFRPKLPAYLAEAFEELYSQDGLLVLGRGLGLIQILTAFCYFYADFEREGGHVSLVAAEKSSKNKKDALRVRPLVFVLGLRESESISMMNQMQDWGVSDPNLLPTFITSESGLSQDRAVLYQRGGVFVITSRILIVDLLNQVVHASEIECFLVAHAESVTELSTEAFILRIYKTQHGNRQTLTNSSEESNQLCRTVTAAAGAVKAFTSQPADLLDSFAKVDKVLKALQVRKLYLYPRFHASISDELEQNQPHVDELHVQLTPLMNEIQLAIASAVQTCIRELKKVTNLIEWSDPDISIKNCLTKNFDQAIYRQLEKDWHKLPFSTRQLVSDLRTLRTLFQYLIDYDSVAFYKLLQNLRASSAASRTPAMWLLTPAADLLFRKAKERLYTIEWPKLKTTDKKALASLVPVLEENPKLKLARSVLTEIRGIHEKKKHRNIRANNAGGTEVLVMLKDKKSLEALRSYLLDGRDRMMSLRWLNFLEKVNEKSRIVIKDAGDSRVIGEESRLLLEEESRVRNYLFGENLRSLKEAKKRKAHKFIPDWLKKKRRIDIEKNRGNVIVEDGKAVLDEAIAETEMEMNLNAERDSPWNNLNIDDEEDELFKVQPIDAFRVCFRTYSDTEEADYNLLLQNLRPMFVVLYDTDTAFIRSLEIYSNMITSLQEESSNEIQSIQRWKCRVYFMIFKNSSEERTFLKSLEREQNAFERLIDHKRTMPLPLNVLGGTTQEIMQAMGKNAGTYATGTLPLSVDTRTARGNNRQRSDKERRIVIVDVREFRSALPSILHQQEMRLAPETLTVGDFVLSPVHCVERKSVSDLFGSFASGRLHTQAESMSKYYKCPCLLIEFDPDKSFSLQSINELGGDIKQDSISSRLCLLLMHFPKLRILWSRGPFETVKIFKSLKINHDEPDIHRAVEYGKDESIEAAMASEGSEDINESARDILLRLPGINASNARKIINHCDSIAELVEMSREDLKELLGPLTGQKLFTFFRKKIAAT